MRQNYSKQKPDKRVKKKQFRSINHNSSKICDSHQLIFRMKII